LLLWAGCEIGDLEQSVRAHGLEGTLTRLRDAGVYVTHEEFDGTQPICRNGLTLAPDPGDFDNPSIPHTRVNIPGSTGGTRSAGKRVFYSWDLFSEIAVNESLLYQSHGVIDVPFAIWYPILPGFAGISHVLTSSKFGVPPDRWFSQVRPSDTAAPFLVRLALEGLVWSGRLRGMRFPRPKFTKVQEAESVASWMAQVKQKSGASVLRCYTSSAVRVAEAAMRSGMDIAGCAFFVGGESLTDRRHGYITKTGARAYARYVITELSAVAAGCPYAVSPGDMHLYMDRLAVIQRPRIVAHSEVSVESFLFTSLSRYSPKVALNTEIGDFGRLSTHPCPCLLGQLGFVQHLSGVASYDKLTGEGISILGTDFEALIGTLIAEAGGCPDDFQFWEEQRADGVINLVLALTPNVYDALGDRIRSEILNRLPMLKGGALASTLWQQARTMKVVKSTPLLTKGGKMTLILPRSQWLSK